MNLSIQHQMILLKSIIDEQKIKNAGAIGITQNGHHYTQVIIGTHVQQVANEMDHQMN